jgi:hypothetical protein
MDVDGTLVVVVDLFVDSPKLLLFVVSYILYLHDIIFCLYSERFVGNFLLSRNSWRRDNCEMVLFCLAYSIGNITIIV